MAFRKVTKAPPVPLTNAQQAQRHLRLAEQYLAKSKKAGRIEYHVQLAGTANTHATLALFYQNADPSLVILQGDDDEDEDVDDSPEEWALAADTEPGPGPAVPSAPVATEAAVAPQEPAAAEPCCSKAGPNGRHFGPCASA
jgi:hypothetical protein